MSDQVKQFGGTIYEEGYGMVAKKVMKDKNLSPTARCIYAYLCSYAGSVSESDRNAYPLATTIQEDLGLSEDTFYKHLKQLKAYGYVKVTKEKSAGSQFGRNIYHIIAVPTIQIEIKIPHPKKSGMESPHPNFSEPKTSEPKISEPKKSGTYNKQSLNSNSNINNNTYNNNNEVVVDDDMIMSLKQKIESVIKESVAVKTLKQLLEKSSEKSITDATLTAVEKGKKFGYVVGMLNENPDYTRFDSETKKTGSKYDVWYDMYNRS